MSDLQFIYSFVELAVAQRYWKDSLIFTHYPGSFSALFFEFLFYSLFNLVLNDMYEQSELSV